MTKAHVEDLALFGGPLSFEQGAFVGRPNVGNRERFLERVNDMLDRRWLTNDGRYVQEFERRVADFLGVRHCVATCNGTLALQIAVKATGLHGEVIVPSFTFIATAHGLQWLGITPVFCDVDPRTHNLDPNAVEQRITSNTTGIVATHLWGRPADIDALTALAHRHRLTLLFDAAHAFGSSHKGTMVGNFGAAEVLSFHATKFVNAFEGGAIATNDDDLASRARLMRNFGFADIDTVVSPGINAKLSEVSAAMGLTSLESIKDFVEANRRNYDHYRRGLAGVPGIALIDYSEAGASNYQYIVLEIDEPLTGMSRDCLLQILQAEGIMARRYFYPGCHRMEPYASSSPDAAKHLRQTERLADRVLVLPTGTAITPDDISTICQIIRLSVGHAPAVSARLNQGLTRCATRAGA
jgi:dTDP-4-amino-4,6-dideoxygalactose transaminase